MSYECREERPYHDEPLVSDILRNSDTQHGFKWDKVEVTRIASYAGGGKVLEIRTPTELLTVRVTPSGRIKLDDGVVKR